MLSPEDDDDSSYEDEEAFVNFHDSASFLNSYHFDDGQSSIAKESYAIQQHQLESLFRRGLHLNASMTVRYCVLKKY